MPVSTSSRRSRSSKPRETAARPRLDVVLAAVALAALSAAAVTYVHSRGWLTCYGDAEAHLNIARRILDSRTPGYEQFGTVWLPLPHALMLPLVRDDRLWLSGLAGAIPSALCFVLAGTFLFAAVRRLYANRAAATAAACLFALNPNLLYLQSTAMTEPVFLAALAALLYFTVRYKETRSLWTVLGAALASLAGSLTRYEGWFLIPFVTLFFLLAGGERRWRAAILFGALTSLGPLYWLAHNWWYYGNFLEFYNGPFSAHAIYQRSLATGMARYPGDHDWAKAWLQLRSAAELCAGQPLVWLGVAGGAAALYRRAFWPLALLALPPLFYVWSVHSSATPVFVPHLWPNSYYNTRYGMALFPLLVLAASALVAVAPLRIRRLAALLVVAAGVSPWLAYPRAESWICWKESQVNSEARRAWMAEAAEYFKSAWRPGEGIFLTFSEMAGVLRAAGVPLRMSLHEDNQIHWLAAAARPDLFLWEKWAIGVSGGRVSTAMLRLEKTGPRYDRVKTITVKGGPVIEIYRRAPPERQP